MITKEDIFNFHWNIASGKQADDVIRNHMKWVFNAMEEYKNQWIQDSKDGDRADTPPHMADLTTLKRVKDVFDVCSDHSAFCNGYRWLSNMIDELESKAPSPPSRDNKH
jgi:hypothetical protein